MRADFFGKCALYPELAARLPDRDVLVGQMDGDELRRAIEGPAELVGLHYEKGLVNTILDDLGPEPGPGALPLLQYTLLELWERRRGQWLTVDAYHEIGGVWGSLAQRADDVYANLTPLQQIAAQWILLQLTRFGEGTEDTRRRATMTELLPYQGHAADIEIVVQKLTDARLLTTNQGETGHEAVEVSHEALIRGWPRLREWINENRTDHLIHEQLREIAAEWDKHQRDHGYLYQGTRFKEIHQWVKTHESDLSQLEQEFLQDCRRSYRRGQIRRIGVGLMTLVLAVLLIGGVTMMVTERGPFAPRIVWSSVLDFEGMTVSCLKWGADRTMYVGFTGGTMNSNIARSRDGGAVWEFLDLRGRFVWEIAPDPQRADVIYAALGPETPNLPRNQEDGLYRSQDGGESWIRIGNDLPISIVGALEASPTGILYAGSSDYTTPTQVYASNDQGETWSPLQDSPQAAVYHLNWTDGRLLIGTMQGLWQWIEDGRWVHLLKEERVVVMAAVSAKDVVFAGGTGIFELRSGREPRKISDERVRTLDVMPGSPPSFVASTTGGTIVQWGLDAQIRTIAYHDAFGKATFIYFVRVQPDVSGQFWVGTNNGLYQGKMKRWFERL
ncbi:WD-40 repeat protein [Candidatus Vecturithrix granuli]|uniref:WD-40 repeat protein n=1 Tax=Vecturithrix granuli TaxID=1499967 RepID=A0A081C225_VECG1|nr:WD-40 repeat protein [Candidatus Vecturithrix granuli]